MLLKDRGGKMNHPQPLLCRENEPPALLRLQDPELSSEENPWLKENEFSMESKRKETRSAGEDEPAATHGQAPTPHTWEAESSGGWLWLPEWFELPVQPWKQFACAWWKPTLVEQSTSQWEWDGKSGLKRDGGGMATLGALQWRQCRRMSSSPCWGCYMQSPRHLMWFFSHRGWILSSSKLQLAARTTGLTCWICRVHRKPRTQLRHPLHSKPRSDGKSDYDLLLWGQSERALPDQWWVDNQSHSWERRGYEDPWKELRNKLVPQPAAEVQSGWHGTAWLAPETGGAMRSDWETILQFNRQQAALGKPPIPVGKLNQMDWPVVPKLPMAKVQQAEQSPSSTRVEIGRALVEVGPNEEIYPSAERASELALQQQDLRRNAQPDSEPSSQTISSGTGTLETSTSGQKSLESSSSDQQTLQRPAKTHSITTGPGYILPQGWNA